MWNFKPIHWLETNWPNFRQLIWKAAFSFGPNLPKQFSVTEQNSYKDFLVQAIYLLDKRKQYNIKFEAFLAPQNKLTNFAVADLESNIQFWPKPSKTFQCQKTKLLQRFFGSSNLPFRQKKPIQYKIWSLFCSPKQIDQYWGGLIWKAAFSFGRNLPKQFSVTKQTSYKDFLVQAIYLLDKRKEYNIKFEAFLAAPNKLTNFAVADLESSIQFCLKHSKALQCHWIKLQSKLLVGGTYLSDKANQ